MSEYAVHALLSITEGKSEETTKEFPNLRSAIEGIVQLAEVRPDFLAISLLHSEDLSRSLEGAASLGQESPTDTG